MREGESRGFRDALGRFATGVSIITAIGNAGQKLGFTANSFSSVSLNPPLILFSLARSASIFEEFLEVQHLAVSVLRAHHLPVCQAFATPSSEKWRDVDLALGLRTAAPVLADALAVFECRVERHYEGGDHTIFLCQVLEFRLGPPGPPLVFYGGGWYDLQPLDSTRIDE